LTYDFEDSEIPGRVRVTRTWDGTYRKDKKDKKCVGEFIVDSPVKRLRLKCDANNALVLDNLKSSRETVKDR
jgi:hypothetical protein